MNLHWKADTSVQIVIYLGKREEREGTKKGRRERREKIKRGEERGDQRGEKGTVSVLGRGMGSKAAGKENQLSFFATRISNPITTITHSHQGTAMVLFSP